MTEHTYRRSVPFRIARTTLTVAERHLPRSAYNVLYRGLFTTYRQVLLAAYRRRVATLEAANDGTALRRAKATLAVMPHSLVGAPGLEATYDTILDALRRNVPGAVVECGVAQGGSSAIMALALRDLCSERHLWLFDSFEGLPDPTSEDIDPTSGTTGVHVRPLPKGSCLGTLEEVRHLLGVKLAIPESHYSLVKGWFQDTIPATREQIGPIAVLRLDGDWYESTLSCLEGLYEQTSHGGTIIVDDYYSCYGAKRALHEFLARHGDPAPQFTDDNSGGVIYRKA